MKTVRHLLVFGTLCTVFLIASCGGSTVNKNLEDAQFALDSYDYTSAVSSATAATAGDPSNLGGFLLLSSGYSGQSGINLLTLAQVLTTTANSTTLFSNLHDSLASQLTHTGTDYSSGLSSLSTAISTLAIGTTTFTGAPATYGSSLSSTYNGVLQNEYFFQVGILMYIQALGLPTIVAQPGTTAGGVAITQGNITAANTTTVQNDFINGYAALSNSATGIASDNSLLTALRQNYCVLKNVSVATGTASGISQAVLQDLTVCQLNTNYAGPFASGIAGCVTFTNQFNGTASAGGCSDTSTVPAL